MTEIVDILTGLMTDNLWAAPVLSLLAGVITSFTPCSLASVPMLLACVGAVGADRKKSVRLSFAMAAGMAVTFGVFGSVASFIGHRMHEAGHWWTILMGILMVFMALQVFGIVNIIPHIHLSKYGTKKGYAGAFLTGALSGVFCLPLRNTGNDRAARLGGGAGPERMVGRTSHGTLCGGTQSASHRDRNRIWLYRKNSLRSVL